MAIKINTAYKEILTSSMLNEKISGVVGGNEKVNGFDVSISTPTSVSVKPGKAYVNGCSIEETSETKTISLNSEMTSTDGIVYVVLTYIHETKNVEFTCVKTVNTNMVKLATLVIKDGAITELVNHESINTLNTVIGVSADIEAQKIRDAIPSGFTELGQLDYNFMSSNENKVKIKGKSIAYVNGYRVEIPAGTVVDIGKAPEKESREDLLFLEAWKDSDFAKNGKLKWRIRHVAGVDFKTFRDGFGSTSVTVDGVYYHYNYDVIAQGGLHAAPNILMPNSNSTEFGVHCFYSNNDRVTSVNTGKKIGLNDKGLYLAGIGDLNSKNTLKTVDGYSYAIPMFRLYRKPSCGKSTPFEYSKINPIADCSKFAKLIQEDKSERVICENIQGRSLVNKSLYRNYNGGSSEVVSSNTLKADTVYTLSFNVKNKTNETRYLSVEVHTIWVFFMTQIILKPYQQYKIKKVSLALTGSQIEHNLLWIVKNTSNANANFGDVEITDVMILEGDWTNKEMPHYFTGLKSLGQDDGNLITMKNGILNEDTYDINDGNQKLATFADVTYVNAENSIIPKVEATIKKGEKRTPLEKLETKLATDGTETVEFTAIKGRTLQNCYPAFIESSFNGLHGTIEDGYVVLQGTGTDFRNAFIHVDKCLIKPSTKYTMVVSVTENTLVHDFTLTSMHATDVFNTNTKIAKGVKGTYKYVVTTVSQVTNSMFGLRAFLSESETGRVRFKVMLLEGDRTNLSSEELSFVDGIKSVGEAENNVVTLNSCGKNLLHRNSKYASRTWQANIKCNKDGTFTITKQDGTTGVHYAAIRYKCNLKEGKTYNVSAKAISGSYINLAVFRAENYIDVVHHNEITVMGLNPCNRDCRYIDLIVYTNSEVTIGDIQLEEGESTSAYQTYNGCKQNIYLKTPLRGLPNGVCDEIIGNKVIRRVGVAHINGNEAWNVSNTRDNTMIFTCQFPGAVIDKTGGRFPICNAFPCIAQDVLWTRDIEGVSYTDVLSGHLRISILKSKLSKQDRDGFKTWLSQHPITIYYELEQETEEYLENIYEKESIKTYQLDAPLRSLPNGVKDEIKDGVLIRRCEEVDFNGSENGWIIQYDKSGGFGYAFNLKHKAKEYHGQSMHLTGLNLLPANQYAVWEKNNNTIYLDQQVHIYTDGGSMENFKSLLSRNPIKIVYELAVPITIPLKEARPQTTDFSPQRQCAEGKWLRELPNGAKDVVNGKEVVRKIGKVVLSGSEAWLHDTSKVVDGCICLRLNSCLPNSVRKFDDTIIINNQQLTPCADWSKSNVIFINEYHGIAVVKSTGDLSSADSSGFKAWLSKNPITLLYELATPTKEVLADDNYMPYPRHDFNTYCGSMYVGEGRNNILNTNKMPSDKPIIIETDFRKVTDRMKVKDCRYKKCDDGYEISYKTGYGKNLFDINNDVYLGLFSSTINQRQGVVLSKDEWLADDLIVDYATRSIKCGNETQKYRGCKLVIKFKPNTSYVMSFVLSGKAVQTNHNGKEIYLQAGPDRKSIKFVTDNEGQYNFRIETFSSAGYFTLTDIQIEEGMVASDYEVYTPTTKYFENIEENDAEDLRYQVSLTGFNYNTILSKSFDKLLRGEL